MPVTLAELVKRLMIAGATPEVVGIVVEFVEQETPPRRRRRRKPAEVVSLQR
jgi:hypothetical protein